MSGSQYIEFVPGDAPLIVSVPHGGLLEPRHIPDRKGVVAHDANTIELARAFADAYHELTGQRPHLVINHLHRKKLDANRDMFEAAEGHPDAERAWREFHAYIGQAKELAIEMYGWGFYIDLHGHSHAHQRVELGYGVSADDLRYPDSALDRGPVAAQSTLKPFCAPAGERPQLSNLLRGPESLGAILERYGVPSVPSDVQPAPEPGWEYFSGGYNVKRHGARDGGAVGGVQIEVNSAWRRDQAALGYFAHALARATADFLGRHAGLGECAGPIQVRAETESGRRVPLFGAMLTAPARIAVEAPDIAPVRVAIELDGEAIYAGEGFPGELWIRPAFVDQGSHTLAVEIVDGAGERKRHSATFHVRHLRLDASWHDEPLEAASRIAGDVWLAVEPAIEPEELGALDVRLVPVAGGRQGEVVLLEGAGLPARVEFDTRTVPDGVYDLIVSAVTAGGKRTGLSQRVEIKNWSVLDDPLLAPKTGGWIGTVEMLKTVSRSIGWKHVSDRPELFYGDGDRLARSGRSSEWLVWEKENLVRYEITLYAKDPAAVSDVVVSVSEDGLTWKDAPFERAVEAAGGSEWRRVVIRGVAGDGVGYLRVLLPGERLGEESVQLGHVRLVGAASNEGGSGR